MKRKSKAEMVLEIYDREAMGEVTEREIAIINRGLVEEYGAGGVLSPAEIASILIDEDLPVRFDDVFNMNTPDDRYEELFDRMDLSTLSSAEISLRKIHDTFAGLIRENDRRGAGYGCEMMREARKSALRDATNDKLGSRRQAELTEIAEWLTIWLQTPELLEMWLEVRKATPEFRNRFPAM
jgi:hypothetical protein